MTLPLRWAEAALKRWMNWPGFTPCWPRAGPIGGAGVAVPPGAWSLNWTVISFLAMTSVPIRSIRRSVDCGRVDHGRLDALSARALTVTRALFYNYASRLDAVRPRLPRSGDPL